LTQSGGASDNGAMTLHAPRLPFSLDPLIAEAKRRARTRRFLLVALAIAAGGVAAATLALRGSERELIGASGACRITQLNVVPGKEGVAAGTASRAFSLVNASETSCTLHGWPNLRLLLGNGRMVSPRVERDHYGSGTALTVRTIKLAPAATASFRIAESDGTGTGVQTCRAIRALLISLPGAGGRVDVSKGVVYCAPYLLEETPLVAGEVDTFAGN
jgi:hypothetical protein